MIWDAVVIGAGVIGLACAERLARDGRSVLVVEAEDSFGRGTSSRNSEVVHAGLYYPTGSLKASLCIAGRRLLIDWCDAHSVPYRLVGKLIVAATESEEPGLARLLEQAHRNGVTSVAPLPLDQVRALEPEVRCTAALWSPETGVVDSHAFMRSIYQSTRDRGADFVWCTRIVGADRTPSGWRLTTADGSGIESRIIINAAGLDADRVAALAGVDCDSAGYRQRWVKGSYFRLRRRLVRRLVYPVPPAGLSGLGIHATVDLAGDVRLGPDVEELATRTPNYGVDPTRAASFHEAASRYLPSLRLDDLEPHQSGIRPKLGRPGEVRDFVIEEESARGLTGWLNLLGMESPGMTASLAVGDRVAALAAQCIPSLGRS